MTTKQAKGCLLVIRDEVEYPILTEAVKVLLAEIDALRGALAEVLRTCSAPMHEERDQFEARTKAAFNANTILERTK